MRFRRASHVPWCYKRLIVQNLKARCQRPARAAARGGTWATVCAWPKAALLENISCALNARKSSSLISHTQSRKACGADQCGSCVLLREAAPLPPPAPWPPPRHSRACAAGQSALVMAHALAGAPAALPHTLALPRHGSRGRPRRARRHGSLHRRGRRARGVGICGRARAEARAGQP